MKDVRFATLSGASCSLIIRRIIDTLELLERDRIATYLSFASPVQSHYDLANRIISKRHTFLGSKDYLYCYISCEDANIDYFLETVCNVLSSLNISDADRLTEFGRVFYSSTILTLPYGQSKYGWRYFNGRTWITIDRLQLQYMFQRRVDMCEIMMRLKISPDNFSDTMRSAHRRMLNQDTISQMLYAEFNNEVDDKESYFSMASCLYDMRYGIVRRSLPGDLCTLSGNVDPDTAQLHKTDEMLEVLSEWLSGIDVANSYLDILASALSEFSPRYAVINSGTGADGKSTMFHIVKEIFGSYCATMPTTGPASDSKSGGETTPVAVLMIGKRICITADANNVQRVINSSAFKSMSGGDTTYIRRLYSEADIHSPRLKMLILINTNQTEFTATSINELTRLRIVRWLNKRVTNEDRDIVPIHQLERSNTATYKYELQFMRMYGSCLMSNLIMRHMSMQQKGTQLELCSKIRQWTKELVSPKTILRFLNSCTEKYANMLPSVQSHQMQLQDEATSFALNVQGATSLIEHDATIEELYALYTVWRKVVVRFSTTDPTTVDVFTKHMEFYHPIVKRIGRDGMEEHFVPGLRIKSDARMIFNSNSFAMIGTGNRIGQPQQSLQFSNIYYTE